MSWVVQSAITSIDDKWAVGVETMTLNSSATDQSTTYVDFIPFGKDWYLEIDPSATLASGGPIDIDICYESGGTYWELCTTSLSVLAAGTTQRDLIDVSSKGCAPYYKFRIDKTAAQSAAITKTVKFTVLVPPRDGIVY